MKRSLNAMTLGLCLVVAGCGYSATRLLPANYRTIYVEPLTNKIPITDEIREQHGFQTNLTRLEERTTQGIIDRFLFDGNLRVTTNRDKADLVLQGALVDFNRQPVRRLDDGSVEEYRLNLAASLTVRDRQGAIVWEENNLIGDTTYFVSGASAKSETVAVDELITDLARRIVERTIENW